MDFTIIIPTFNSEKYIKECLTSIFDVDYEKSNFEVILVDLTVAIWVFHSHQVRTLSSSTQTALLIEPYLRKLKIIFSATHAMVLFTGLMKNTAGSPRPG